MSLLNFTGRLRILPLILSCLMFGLTDSALAQTRQDSQLLRTLTVTGRGVESIPATIAEVRLGVEVQGKDAEAVQQDVAQRSAAVVALLRARQVENLETTGIRLSPIYSYTNNVQRLTGYQGSNIVSFRIAAQRAGILLDEAVKAGATRIDNISFIAPEAAIATAQRQALREATQDAQQQADAVLSALNLTRKEIVSIQVNRATPPVPFLRAEASNLPGATSTPVIAGEQEVEATVTLQISY